MVNDASSKTKVRRNTKGNILPTESISVGKTIEDEIFMLQLVDAYCKPLLLCRSEVYWGLNLMTLP